MPRRKAQYYAPTKPVVPTMASVRSALTNGTVLLHDLDHRSAWAKRLRDLINAFESDLGHRDQMSEAQVVLVRRCAMLTLQLELIEQKWANNDGEASPDQLHRYQSCSNSLRRISESLGLNRGRRPRPVESPLEYARRLEAERGAA